MTPVLWAIAPAALVGGFVIGWLVHNRRSLLGTNTDWLTRVAARDRELEHLREQLHDAVARTDHLEEIRSAAATGELESRLERAETELTVLRNRPERDPDPELRARLEQLEYEAETLASQACPDPSAHPAKVEGPPRAAGA